MFVLPSTARVTRSFEPSGDHAPSIVAPGPGTRRLTWRPPGGSPWTRCWKRSRQERKRRGRAPARELDLEQMLEVLPVGDEQDGARVRPPARHHDQRPLVGDPCRLVLVEGEAVHVLQ